MLPFATFGRDLWVAVADPLDTEGLQFIEARTGLRAMPLIAPRSVIAATVDRFFGEQAIRLDAPIRALIETLIGRGVLTAAGAAQVLQSLVAGTLPLDQAIAQASTLPATEMVKALAELLAVPLVDLRLREQMVSTLDPLGQPVTRNVARDPVDATAARLLDLETAQRLAALPVARAGNEITVAFTDPHFEPALREIQTILGLQVRPCLAPRGSLEEAIQRVLGRKNIGTSLLLAGVISRGQLNDALDLAQRTGVRLGRALLNRGYVTQQQLSQFLAEQARLPFFDLTNVTFDEAIVRLIDPGSARKFGMLPIAADPEQVTLAMVDPLNDEALQTAARMTGRMIRPVLVSEQNIELSLERIYGREYLARSVSELLERSPEDSAYRVLSRGQKIALVLFAITSVLGLLLDYRIYIVVLNALSTLFYLSFSTYKFYLVYRATTRNLEVPVTDEDMAALNDRDLPIYTILIPAYREAEVLPDLLAALGKLDYPTTKLDIKVLMEADDLETIQAFDQMNPPSHFQGVIVPTAQPKTKPKACNYGLIHARGDYVVIFDAEDLPDPDQLKRVLVAFRKSPPEVACIQCKLNYYNRSQNLLTAWFTVEYSMWFDLFLPGLDASHAPIPLGGTSNHFKREVLIESGAWDPHNVTEDADLGTRIFKRGYRTAIVDSTTYEEANSEIYNWIRQRSRWIKGYIQTWLVHMRHPLKLYKEIGGKAFWGFQFTVGGTFFAALLNPVYWVLTALWFFAKWGFIREIFPSLIFYAGAVCLYVGNFAFTYMNVAGAMRRGYYELVKYALLSPLYWGLASVAAWKGFWQLITKPHFWEKTHHGLYEGAPSTEKADQLRDLI
jgi:cellulose synthase/poly-beta-1,6-N-acetylglucosamine synthase-like glycosyltransferase